MVRYPPLQVAFRRARVCGRDAWSCDRPGHGGHWRRRDGARSARAVPRRRRRRSSASETVPGTAWANGVPSATPRSTTRRYKWILAHYYGGTTLSIEQEPGVERPARQRRSERERRRRPWWSPPGPRSPSAGTGSVPVKPSEPSLSSGRWTLSDASGCSSTKWLPSRLGSRRTQSPSPPRFCLARPTSRCSRSARPMVSIFPFAGPSRLTTHLAVRSL